MTGKHVESQTKKFRRSESQEDREDTKLNRQQRYMEEMKSLCRIRFVKKEQKEKVKDSIADKDKKCREIKAQKFQKIRLHTQSQT